MRVGISYRRAALEGPWDAIVVGSGMGSLSTAAILARRAGKRVLVLERHHEVGGFTHVFRRQRYEWDVGFHYLGQVNRPEHEFTRGFDYVTEGRLRWQAMPDVYERIRIADRTYDFPTGAERLREKLKGYFPSEAAAIDRYLEAVFDCVAGRYFYFLTRAAPRFVDVLFGYFLKRRLLRYADRTTESVLGELTRDRELIAVLTGQWADYGLPPRQSSFASHAILVHHFFEGGAYPVGGSGQFAAALAPTIEAKGGAICVGAEVEQILLDARSRAVGVKMKDGRELRAPLVISGVGAPLTFGSLLPGDHPRRRTIADAVAQVPPSISHLGLYLGIKREAGAPELDGANLWVYPHADHDRSMAEFENDLDAPFPVLFLSFPSAKDPAFAERVPGHSTVSAVVPVPFRAFERWSGTRWKKRGDEYEAFKQKLTQRLVADVRRQVPAIRGEVEVAELSTPLSTQHFTNNPHGEIYGMAPVPGRFRTAGLAAQTPFAGLYLTGQDVAIAGVAGAFLSGVLTASAVLGKNLVPEVFGATVFR